MIGVWFCRVMMVLALSNLILDVIIGDWLPLVPDVLAAALFFAGQRTSYRALARRDLREVYPPRRDRFQRDLERLNKLRGASAVALPKTLPTERSRLGGIEIYDDDTQANYLLLPDGGQQAPKSPQKCRRSDDALGRAFVTVLEGARDGFRIMAPFLVIMLFGAVIGLVVSLL